MIEFSDWFRIVVLRKVWNELILQVVVISRLFPLNVKGWVYLVLFQGVTLDYCVLVLMTLLIYLVER